MWQTLETVLKASWQQLAAEVAHVLPNALASLLIFIVGVGVGLVGGRVTRWILVRAKLDRAAARLGILGPLGRAGVSSLAALVGRVVQWAIIVAALIPALYSLDSRVASDLVGRSLLYLPHLAIAVVLLWLGFVLSRFLARGVLIAAVNAQMRSARLLANATQTGVMLVTVAIAFEHLGIGRATVLTAFAILFGGVTLAAALAVGLGSQEVVRRWWAGFLETPPPTSGDDEIHHV